MKNNVLYLQVNQRRLYILGKIINEEIILNFCPLFASYLKVYKKIYVSFCEITGKNVGNIVFCK